MPTNVQMLHIIDEAFNFLKNKGCLKLQMMIWVSVVFMMIFMQAVINCPKTVVLGKSVVTPGKDGTPVN